MCLIRKLDFERKVLRSELKRRRLSSNGSKSALVERLNEADRSISSSNDSLNGIANSSLAAPVAASIDLHVWTRGETRPSPSGVFKIPQPVFRRATSKNPEVQNLIGQVIDERQQQAHYEHSALGGRHFTQDTANIGANVVFIGYQPNPYQQQQQALPASFALPLTLPAAHIAYEPTSSATPFEVYRLRCVY